MDLSFHLVSLGCAKNLVDSEVILGGLSEKGLTFRESPVDADLLIVNTCGFIQPAVEEAIEEILELVRIKRQFPSKKLIVVGCLVQRYGSDLAEELPEVDLFVGTEAPHRLYQYIGSLADPHNDKVRLPPRYVMGADTPRLLSTPGSRAWLKITEGCNNRCSYCMIPQIRGELRSRFPEDIVVEAERLDNVGIKELSFVAQDITAYGDDLSNDVHLVALLNLLLKRTSIPWIRLLYLYPGRVHDELIDIMASEERIVPYLDLPLQHINDRILSSMNRHYQSRNVFDLLSKLRSRVPDIAIRTTLLVGFPGETEQEFLELVDFLQKWQLDHVGIFAYTNEEGAGSEFYSKQVPDKEKYRRRDYLFEVQAQISKEKIKKYIGNVEQVLVEGVSDETDLLLEGRTRYQAPDVDGCVYINEGTASPGEIVSVNITEAQIYDLVGGVIGND